MRALQRAVSRSVIGALLCAVCVAPVWADGFFVLHAEARLDAGIHRLSAKVRYDLSSEVREAIDNGIPVALRLDIEIERPRAFRWAESLAELQQMYHLQYHALTRRYVAANVNSGAQDDYATLDEALSSLSVVTGLPLIDAALLEPGESYVVRVRADLDHDVLPMPLRYYANIFPSWRLTSEWYTFPLK